MGLVAMPVPAEGESMPCPECGALGRWYWPDDQQPPPMWRPDQMHVVVTDATQAGQCPLCMQMRVLQGRKPAPRPVDPVERMAGRLEAEIRAGVARANAISGQNAAGPAALPSSVMRAIGVAVEAVLREYREAVGSTALPYPGDGADEMARLRAILWRISSGEITDWTLAACSATGNKASLTLYYPEGL